METLILIGVILLILVLCVDCVIRVVIVWKMRKQKRAVKPLDVIEQDAEEVRINNRNNADGENNPAAEEIENQDNSMAV